MKLTGIICVLLLLLHIPNLRAQVADDLSVLRQKAAANKSLKGYSDVCRYLYEKEESPELLSLYADTIRQLGVSTKSPDCFIEFYIWKSEACFIRGEYENGYALKRKAITLAETVGSKNYIADCSSDMGYYFNVDMQYDSARYYFKKGMAAINDMPGLADKYRTMLTNYASSFLFEGKTDSALVYTLRAVERSAADKDTAMLINNLNQLGTIYRRKKNLEQSIAHFEKALRLCEAQNDYKIAAYIYGNIATAYCDWSRPKDAIPFSEKAVEYAQKLGNKQMEGICYVNLGAILCNMADTRNAGISTLQKAIPLLEEINNRRRLCEAYDYLINAYRQMGQFEVAKGYLKKMDKLVEGLKTDVEYYRYYRVKAAVLEDDGQYAEAIVYYLRMVNLLENGYQDARDYERYLHLAKCYSALHNDAKAYIYLDKAYGLRDSLFQTEKTEQLSDYSVRYKTAEKELEITRLKQKDLELKAQLVKRGIMFGTVLALLIIMLLVLLFARQRQKARLAGLAKVASDKEREFLELQKETELRLTRKYIDGLESERHRMATELHDDVCNNLLALEMDVRSLPAVEGGAGSEQLRQLESIRLRLRSMSHELMPPAFQYATIDEMLSDYVHHLPLPSGMQAEYSSTEEVNWQVIPQEIGFEIYRIVQEAVTNTLKYAHASYLHVSLSLKEKQLSVQVFDDGKGFEVNKKTSGIGLRTIQQRANAIGAKVEIDSKMGDGTHLIVTVLV